MNNNETIVEILMHMQEHTQHIKVTVNSHGHSIECLLCRLDGDGHVTMQHPSVEVSKLSISDCNTNTNRLYEVIKDVAEFDTWLPKSDKEKYEIARDISETITPLFCRLESRRSWDRGILGMTAGFGRKVMLSGSENNPSPDLFS